MREMEKMMNTASHGINRLLFCGFGLVEMGDVLLRGSSYFPVRKRTNGWPTVHWTKAYFNSASPSIVGRGDIWPKLPTGTIPLRIETARPVRG
jgi:hypothetical protein